MADIQYPCPSCGYFPLTWDSDGSLSGLGIACWYCPNCEDIFPVSSKYPAPEE